MSPERVRGYSQVLQRAQGSRSRKKAREKIVEHEGGGEREQTRGASIGPARQHTRQKSKGREGEGEIKSEMERERERIEYVRRSVMIDRGNVGSAQCALPGLLLISPMLPAGL